MSWLIVDLETENHEYYNSVASPFHAQNYRSEERRVGKEC